MAQIFSSVPPTKISRSRHNLSHQVKASFDPGKLNPILTELARPGDTWKCSLEQFIRTMPMIAPVMDMVDIKVDAFFVPIRLIWDDFEDFITLGLTGEFEAIPPTISRIANDMSADGATLANKLFGIGSLSDFLNFPTNVVYVTGGNISEKVDALPYRAYQFIYNEYYLNENLDTPIPIDTSSGDLPLNARSGDIYQYQDDFNHFLLKNRGWRKDYFTSALPFPQKGPAVKIPYGDLEIKASRNSADTADSPLILRTLEDNRVDFSDPTIFAKGVSGAKVTQLGVQAIDSENIPYYDSLKYDQGLRIVGNDLPTIEELRYAEVLQEFYEANARGGTRPKEYYLNIWHTRSKDSRLDRPEYLGGYRGPITISDIDQTSQSATTAQGTLAGKGVSAGGQKLFRYHVPEWGIIMVIMSVQPKTAYYQGYRRWNLYKDAFDWPNPFFANLGEQEIYNKEIYTDPSDNKDDNTFGYTPRYSECKFIPDTVHGQFRSTLDYWHLARKFGSRPNLNSAFVHVQTSEVARIFPSQVDNNDKLVGTFFFHISCKMYLPYWGVPRLLHSI